MKFALSAACAVFIIGMQAVHAHPPAPTPPEVMAFLESTTYCSVLLGGADLAADGADRIYAESLNEPLTALGGSPPSAAEGMRLACASGSTQSTGLAKAAP